MWVNQLAPAICSDTVFGPNLEILDSAGVQTHSGRAVKLVHCFSREDPGPRIARGMMLGSLRLFVLSCLLLAWVCPALLCSACERWPDHCTLRAMDEFIAVDVVAG